ncbi:Beta-lactamase [Candidatus Sulfopaludibacter sp. SbA3]|nr:Beta-lactamase [Candidatus Sulfopaludibacter sp. SbA3]
MDKLQFRVLYREFLFRMVDLEVLSAHALGDANKLLGRFAALLVFISVWMSLGAIGFAGLRMAPIQSLATSLVTAQALIATTMLVVGLFAVLSWDSTFPDRRDVLVLAPLPVRARTMFLAKVAAVASALCVTVVLLHGAMGMFWPFAFMVQAVPQTVPAYTFDPTPVPVSPADLEGVLARDLKYALPRAGLVPGSGAGLVVGAWKHGQSRILTYGAARPDALFEIGSITKTFTGLMLAQMVIQQKVELDEPIRLLLPEGLVTKPAGAEIRLVDLATQHSDLPRAVPGDWLEYLSRRGVSRRLDAPFSYSNFGFGLLGQLLATRAGLTYSEFLKEQITGPLGLMDTVVALSPEQQSRLIQGYDAQHRPVPWEPEGLAGSGAIRSTAADMLKYLAANLHPETLGGTLPQALALAHRPRAEGAPGTVIGLAWWHSPSDGSWSHGGAMHGFTSNAFFSPKDDDAAVVLLNNGPDDIGLADLLTVHIRQRMAGEPAVSLDTAFVPASHNILRWYGAYWFTMLASGVFTYWCVLGLQGIAAQLLPRRPFLRVSSPLQMAAFCLFVCGYFMQPVFGGLQDLTGSQIQQVLLWLPPYWFLGLFQQLNGSMHPALVPLAQRGWLGLAIAGGATAVSYTLSYLRTLRKIAEEPDITPGLRRLGWLPPFGSPVQTAIGQFAVRTLARSRQHRMILAFYLGIGFAFTAMMLKAPEMKPRIEGALANDQWRAANTPLLAASLVMLVLAVVGTRVVFALPLDLRANWVFRIAGVPLGRQNLVASRRALLLIAVVPIWLATAVLCFWLWPWQQAVGHLALLGLIGILVSDIRMHNFHKIPFTCSYLPGKSMVHLIILGALGLMQLVLLSVKFELQMLQQARSTASLVVPFAVAALIVRAATSFARADEEEIEFEEVPAPAVLELGLHRDGVMPVGENLSA